MRFLKEIKKLFKGNLGYTLLEVAAVIAVTGTLAAVAMPVVKDKIGDAKRVAALENMRNLSGAITQYYGDVNLWPNAGVSGGPPVGVLSSSSDTDAQLGSTADSLTISKWLSVTSVYTGAVLSKNSAGRSEWKGPYLSDPEMKDPWGHPFYVAVEEGNLSTSAACGAGHSPTDKDHRKAIFILSAGPDEIIKTERLQCMQAFVSDADDVVLRIR